VARTYLANLTKEIVVSSSIFLRAAAASSDRNNREVVEVSGQCVAHQAAASFGTDRRRSVQGIALIQVGELEVPVSFYANDISSLASSMPKVGEEVTVTAEVTTFLRGVAVEKTSKKPSTPRKRAPKKAVAEDLIP